MVRYYKKAIAVINVTILLSTLNCKQDLKKEKDNSFTPLMMNTTASGPTGGSSSGGISVDPAMFQLALDDARIQAGTKSISAAIVLGDGKELTAVSNEEGDPDAVTSDMNFSVASVTKMFIAACVIKLVEEKKLSFDDTLQKLLYDPNIPDTKHKLNSSFSSKIAPLIRVKDLLHHTTGIDDFLGDQYYVDIAYNVYDKWTPVEILGYVTSPNYTYDSDNPENNLFAYSNTDYILLGMIIENVSNKKVFSVVSDYFLKPLKMNSTYMVGVDPYWGLTSIPDPKAIGFEYYDETVGGWVKTSTIVDVDAFALYTSTWTSGNMRSTAIEMARWAKYYYHYQFDKGYLNNDALKSCFIISQYLSKKKYGYGIEYFKHYNGYEFWGHTGTIAGFRSLVFYLPKKDISIALLFNEHRPDRWEVFDLMLKYIDANL
jgi:D-alanyl-D-alanine carboxypeptidase